MNCDSHCNAKCKMLGGLEQKIMDALWSSSQPLKPAEVVSRLSGTHAYTTISTVLKRMSDKGIVLRQATANVFFYQAATPKSEYACHCLEDLFVRLFDTYGKEVVSSFKKIAKQEKYII